MSRCPTRCPVGHVSQRPASAALHLRCTWCSPPGHSCEVSVPVVRFSGAGRLDRGRSSRFCCWGCAPILPGTRRALPTVSSPDANASRQNEANSSYTNQPAAPYSGRASTSHHLGAPASRWRLTVSCTTYSRCAHCVWTRLDGLRLSYLASGRREHVWHGPP
jgi:hypothetical protein